MGVRIPTADFYLYPMSSSPAASLASKTQSSTPSSIRFSSSRSSPGRRTTTTAGTSFLPAEVYDRPSAFGPGGGGSDIVCGKNDRRDVTTDPVLQRRGEEPSAAITDKASGALR